MANRKSLSGILGAVALATVVTIYQENIAAWLEAHKLNRLFSQGSVAGFVSASVRFLVSPWLTHLYAFLFGFVALAVLQAIIQAKYAEEADTRRKANMTLAQAFVYLTTNSQWAVDHPHPTNQMIQLELIDALAGGQLNVLARVRLDQGNLSPLYRVERSYFNDVLVDIDSLRRGALDAIRPTSSSFQEQYVDFHVWQSEVELMWPLPTNTRRRPKGERGSLTPARAKQA